MVAGQILPGDLTSGRAIVEPASAADPGITAITTDMITVRPYAVRQRPSARAGAWAAGMPAVTDQTRSAPGFLPPGTGGRERAPAGNARTVIARPPVHERGAFSLVVCLAPRLKAQLSCARTG